MTVQDAIDLAKLVAIIGGPAFALGGGAFAVRSFGKKLERIADSVDDLKQTFKEKVGELWEHHDGLREEIGGMRDRLASLEGSFRTFAGIAKPKDNEPS